MKVYKIEYKKGIFLCMARNREQAFAKFFLNVLNGVITLEELGQVIFLIDGRKQYPFRTVPTLMLLGLIDEETAIYNISKITGATREEAKHLLYHALESDKWVIEEIKKLREKT